MLCIFAFIYACVLYVYIMHLLFENKDFAKLVSGKDATMWFVYNICANS